MAKILIIDDEADIRSTLREVLEDEGHDVQLASNATEARSYYNHSNPEVTLLDIWMPDTDGITLLREWSAQGSLNCPVIIMSGHGTIDTAIEATRLGAIDYLEKPLSLAKLLQVVQKALIQTKKGKPQWRQLSGVAVPVGRSVKMQKVRETIQQLAKTEAATLIVGEPGSGRETHARYLHSQSARAQAPLVVVSPGLIDIQEAALRLRGEEKDGKVIAGLYDEARGGSLLLKDIEDFPRPVQAILAADFENGEYLRIGGSQKQRLDVRVIATSVYGADSAVSTQHIQPQLLLWLSGAAVQIPPLREVAEDVPDLLRQAVEYYADREQLPLRRFSIAAQNRLRHYPWPLNVEELFSLVHRLLLTGSYSEVSLEELESIMAPPSVTNELLVKQDLLALPLREARDAFERAYLLQQLQLCNGKVGVLAKRVAMERTHLYRKLRSLNIDFRQGSDD